MGRLIRIPAAELSRYPLPVAVGIGIFAAGSVEISNNTIQGNNTISPVSGSGGGVIAYDTRNLTIENNAICGNTAAEDPGGHSGGATGGVGVLGIGDLALIQNLIYSNVVIGGNDPAAGVGIGTEDSTNPMPSGTVTIINNTVVANQDDYVVDGEQLAVGGPAQWTIEDNIFESTDGQVAVYCVPGTNPGFSYNDVFGGSPSRTCGGFNNISTDPKFSNAVGDDFHLTASSPAIAGGDIAAPDLPSADFDGLPRIVNGAISLGVYEYQPVTADSPLLTSSANPSYVAQAVTFSATLNTSAARLPVTGTMTFRDGAATLGTVNVSAAGVAALSTSSLSVGDHAVYAI